MTSTVVVINKVVGLTILLFLLCASTSLASSPSEPAYSSQLRTCFEPNRDTKCIATTDSWYGCGGSMYSSYEQAVSVSLNCMRSTCGIQNSLCCNTYCGMFGVSGYEYNVCFNKCFNPQQGVVATTATAAATTLMKASLDTNAVYTAPSTSKDDNTKVYCDVKCDSEFAFYSTNGKNPLSMLKSVSALLASDGVKTLGAASKRKYVLRSSGGSSSSSARRSSQPSRSAISSRSVYSGRSASSGRSIAISSRRSVYVGRSSGSSSAAAKKLKNSDLVYKRLINFRGHSIGYLLRGISDKKIRKLVENGVRYLRAARNQEYPQKLFAIYSAAGKLLVEATALLGNLQLVQKRSTIFPALFNSLVPSTIKKKDCYNGRVKHNQICSSTVPKTVKVEYYNRSRITCAKIKSWMSGASTIYSGNLYQVYKFLFLVYNQCKKAGSTCVVPMLEGIKVKA